MNLLISTHKGLYKIELKEDTATLQHLSFGYYYGLGVWEDTILAGRRIDPYSKESPTAFELWDKEGNCLGTPDLDGNTILDVHQIAAGPRGYYICSTNKNILEIYNHDFEHQSSLSFEKDDIHGGILVNSVYVDGDHFWVSFQNAGSHSFSQHFCHHGSDFVFCNRNYLYADGSHNIIHHNGWIYYNDSDAGCTQAVEEYGLDTEDWDLKGQIPAKQINLGDDKHTKGLAIHPASDRLICGVSEKGELEHRFKSESHLILAELSAMNPLTAYKLCTADGLNIGNINEIRILD